MNLSANMIHATKLNCLSLHMIYYMSEKIANVCALIANL